MINKREYPLVFSLLFTVIVIHSDSLFWQDESRSALGHPVSCAFPTSNQHLGHLAWKWVTRPITRIRKVFSLSSQGPTVLLLLGNPPHGLGTQRDRQTKVGQPCLDFGLEPRGETLPTEISPPCLRIFYISKEGPRVGWDFLDSEFQASGETALPTSSPGFHQLSLMQGEAGAAPHPAPLPSPGLWVLFTKNAILGTFPFLLLLPQH